MAEKVFKFLAWVSLIVAIVLILIGYVGTLVNDGLGEFLWLFSPFNWANYLMLVLTFAPTFIFFKLANKFSSGEQK